MELDVSSFISIRKFCSEFKLKYQKLDVLIHNAGYFNHGIKSYQFSADNIELTFATNVFGPYLLTELLKNHLTRSNEPRVLSANSTNIKHFFDPKRKIEFDNLQGEFKDSRAYNSYKMYGDSKMGLLLLTYKMAEMYKPYKIKLNSIMIPAVKVSRESLNKFNLYYRILGLIIQNINPYSLSPDHMADIYFQICTSDKFNKATGSLINSDLEIIPPPENTQSINILDLFKELWNTKHTPAYASNPQHIHTMWEVCEKVVSKADNKTRKSNAP